MAGVWLVGMAVGFPRAGLLSSSAPQLTVDLNTVGCFVASLAGVWLVGMAVRRSGRASYVVVILTCIIGLGALLTGVFGGRKAIEALEAHQGIGFHAFC